jgi:hypothetical protein
MTDPFRLRVLQALTTSLEQINPDNGFAFDLRGKVFRGRDVFGDRDPMPLISILEAIEEQTQLLPPQSSPVSTGPWELLVQGFVDDDLINPTDPAYRLIAEVKQRLIEERIRERQYDILGMGGLVTELRISSGVVRPSDDISGKAYFWLRLTLVVVENLLDPYA